MDKQNNQNGILQVAKKKRHIQLLEKLQRGKTLTRTEIKELEKLEGGSLPAGVVDTEEKASKAFKVSVRTIRRWKQDGMPVTPEGNYDLTEIQAWRFTKNNKNKNKDSEKDDWDGKYRKMKYLLAEIEYKKRLEELIPREEVEAGIKDRILAVKKHFLALPKRIVPQLEGLDVKQREKLLTARIKEVIKGFAEGKY